MNKNKHLLLWSSLATLGLLLVAATQEHHLKPWRVIQSSVRGEAGALDQRLRQIVVPALGTADRCVTCHVGMEPGQVSLEGHVLAAPHPPLAHDIAQYGCTTCHAGQGRATDPDDAHGEVRFWPSPMIPLRYAEASCGTCHTHSGVPCERELERGKRMLERADCLACHRVDGRGGTLRPGGVGGMEGPDLSQVGASGLDRHWYARHVEQHERGNDAAWRGTFGHLEPAELEAIEGYLATRVGAPKLIEAKAAFHSLGCLGCHRVGDVGGDDGPALNHPILLATARDDYLLDSIRLGRPATAMPGFGQPSPVHPTLAAEDLEAIVSYLRTWEKSE